MSDINIAAGTTLSVCAALPETLTQAGYEALTFTQVKGVRSVGDIGKTHQTLENRTIGKVPYNQRVGIDINTLQLELFRIDDAGQYLLRAAVDDADSYSYRVVAPGLTRYFTAGCSARLPGTGDSKTICDTRVTLEIDSEVIEI